MLDALRRKQRCIAREFNVLHDRSESSRMIVRSPPLNRRGYALRWRRRILADQREEAAIEDHDRPRRKSVIFSSRARVWQRSGFPGPAQARKGNQTVELDNGHREPLLTVDVV
jgi:hypothetical protein